MPQAVSRTGAPPPCWRCPCVGQEGSLPSHSERLWYVVGKFLSTGQRYLADDNLKKSWNKDGDNTSRATFIQISVTSANSETFPGSYPYDGWAEHLAPTRAV